ncbi:MAG: helix-turn-helix domain-containing protein [Atopobiaceae bacterium]|nr:helix-turn-helix domain-containing protein [Atopobiaceae bacterium]
MANKYTDEYRREAVDYVLNSEGKSIKECARELGLNDKTLSHWVSRFKKGGQDRIGHDRRGQGDCQAQEGERAAQDGERVPKKSKRPLRQEPSVEERYLLMAAERAKYPVKMMAELLEVSRQGSCQSPDLLVIHLADSSRIESPPRFCPQSLVPESREVRTTCRRAQPDRYPTVG